MITDVVAVLTGSVKPKAYIKDMRRRDPELAKGGGKLPPPFPLKPKSKKCGKAIWRIGNFVIKGLRIGHKNCKLFCSYNLAGRSDVRKT